MLKGIDPRLGAEVLGCLRAMGHGDVLILSDTNFPSDSVARATVYGSLLRMDNLTSAQATQAILSVYPLDTFVPDFAGRMTEIRARVKPKLAALGADLTGQIGDAVGGPMYPHVAQHMRRRVNPPPETWVAFCRDKKGYKRWTHFRIAVSGDGVRVTTFVEDDADDKPVIAAALLSKPTGIIRKLDRDSGLLWYTFGKKPIRHKRITAAVIASEAERLGRVKLEKFQAGVPLAADDALAMSPEQFEEWVMAQIRVEAPLYALGIPVARKRTKRAAA